jgi:hypothetical protein
MSTADLVNLLFQQETARFLVRVLTAGLCNYVTDAQVETDNIRPWLPKLVQNGFEGGSFVLRALLVPEHSSMC